MRFAPTDDQIAFAEAVSALLDNHCSPAHLRSTWESGTAPDGLWAQLVEMGVIAMLVPESAGGLGMTDIDIHPIIVAAGAAALPLPLSMTAAVAAPTVAQCGEVGADVLALIAEGSSVGVVSDANSVAYGADLAGVLQIRASELRWHPRDVINMTGIVSVDGARGLAGVEFLSDGILISRDPTVVATALARLHLTTAAELVGLSDTMIAMTVAYVSERKQFGVPIGSFQAMKHHCANAVIANDFARPLVARAAYSVSVSDADATTHAHMALAAASEASATVSRIALQCHGAIGYTTECDLHLYMKRAWALVLERGDAHSQLRQVAVRLFA